MTFDETLFQVTLLLQQEGRVAYRSLKRRFGLDDEELEDVKAELIDAKQIAVDENDRVLVWAGRQNQSADSLGHSPQSLSSSLSQAERRQLTVMFCDIVGSTPLAEQLDPEEFREVIQAYQTLCEQQAHPLGGYVALYMGDGILFYFGYPIAYEDAAARAIRAGLGIISALPGLNTRLQTQLPLFEERPLQIRIGIHTGLVVVGEMGGSDYRAQVALGETPNIAARVQEVAAPNTVAISARTHQLVAGLFECHELGHPLLKGVSSSILVYRVLNEGEAQSRFDIIRLTGLSALVGRTEELNMLHRRWSQAKSGAGQLVWLEGEAGIGKSRLVHELQEQIRQERATRLEFRCDPYHQHTSLYPVIRLLERVFQLQRADSPLKKYDQLKHALSGYRFPRADTALLLAELLSLPLPEGVPALTLSSEKKRQRTQETLIEWIYEEAERRPTLCVCEDVHWADPSSLALLDLCLQKLSTAPLLLVLSSRPGFVPPWQDSGKPPNHIQLTLRRLPQAAAQALIAQIAAGRDLPSTVVQQVLSRTDGVPLFIEELTKTVMESGVLQEVEGRYELTGSLTGLDIPATLHDSLMARLDRLEAKELSQIGATLGREFRYELLQAVSGYEEVSLQQGLQRLCQAGLLYQNGVPPHATFFFKHALIQETAYQSLLRRTRQQLHQTTAQVLEERFPQIAETQPEILAHHYTQAGRIERAIPYWRQAGERANTRAAHAEAIQHAQTGLDLLSGLPEGAARNHLELGLLILLGGSLSSNYGAREVKQTYDRARELCQQIGETPEIFSVLRGLSTFYTMNADHTTGRKLAEQCLQFAQSSGDPARLIEGYTGLGCALVFVGDMSTAHSLLEQGLALYEEQRSQSFAFLTPQDPGIACLSFLPWVLWMLGYPDQAYRRYQQAIALAEQLDQPFNTAYMHTLVSLFDLLRQEPEHAARHAQTAIRIGTKHGYDTLCILSTLQLGVVRCIQDPQTGIRDLTQALDAWQLDYMRPYWLAELSQAYWRTGQLTETYTFVNRALDIAQRNGESWYAAEYYRLRGEYTLAQAADRQGEAEADFLQALELAQTQQAKALELRAALSLSRLWRHQEKRAEARSLLYPISTWFTEGADSRDLQQAKTLLTELGDG